METITLEGQNKILFSISSSIDLKYPELKNINKKRYICKPLFDSFDSMHEYVYNFTISKYLKTFFMLITIRSLCFFPPSFDRHGRSGRVCFLLPQLFITEVLFSMVGILPSKLLTHFVCIQYAEICVLFIMQSN